MAQRDALRRAAHAADAPCGRRAGRRACSIALCARRSRPANAAPPHSHVCRAASSPSRPLSAGRTRRRGCVPRAARSPGRSAARSRCARAERGAGGQCTRHAARGVAVRRRRRDGPHGARCAPAGTYAERCAGERALTLLSRATAINLTVQALVASLSAGPPKKEPPPADAASGSGRADAPAGAPDAPKSRNSSSAVRERARPPVCVATVSLSRLCAGAHGGR